MRIHIYIQAVPYPRHTTGGRGTVLWLTHDHGRGCWNAGPYLHPYIYILTVCMYVRTYVCMYVCRYVCTYVRTYVCMYVCDSFIFKYIYIYTYISVSYMYVEIEMVFFQLDRCSSHFTYLHIYVHVYSYMMRLTSSMGGSARLHQGQRLSPAALVEVGLSTLFCGWSEILQGKFEPTDVYNLQYIYICIQLYSIYISHIYICIQSIICV